jgi:GT2 family glycosyltransferase
MPYNQSSIVSVIIITYRRHQDVVDLLDTLCRQSFRDFEVILIDNEPASPLRSSIDQSWPFILHYKNMPMNLGVAGGRNQGIQAAQSEYLVFIDDDALFLRGDALDRVVHTFRTYPELGCIAFQIRNYYTRQIARGEFPRSDHTCADQEIRVGYFVGAGHAIKKEVFDKVGCYPEDFIYGVEELDLSYRMIIAGYKILYIPEIVVLHKASPAGRLPTADIIRHYLRNRIQVVTKYLPYRYWPSHLLIWIVFLLWRSLRCRSLGSWALGISDAIRELPVVPKERLNNEAQAYLKQVKGRLWY